LFALSFYTPQPELLDTVASVMREQHSASLTCFLIQSDTKKRELLKNATKIEEIREKKFIDRNWNITTCLL